MEIGSVSKLLADSPFADKAQEIEAIFERLGITTLNDLDNAPRALGMRIAGYSSYQVCRYVRDAAIQAVMEGPIEEELPDPEPEPETVETVEEVVVVLEQDEESTD